MMDRSRTDGKKQTHLLRWRVLPACLAALGLVLSACGGQGSQAGQSGSEGSSPELAAKPSGTSDSALASIAAEAQEKLDSASDPEDFEWPEPPPIDVGERRTVAIVSCGEAGSGCRSLSAAAREATEAIGWDATPTCDGEFEAAKQSGCIQRAINDGVDAILLSVIEPVNVTGAVDAAYEANIPVVTMLSEGAGFEDKVTAITPDWHELGQAYGAFVLSHVDDGPVDVAMFTDTAEMALARLHDSAQEAIESKCPECDVRREEIATAEVNKPGPPTWTGFLSGTEAGSYDFVLAPYDYLAVPFAKTAREYGRMDIQIGGAGGWEEMILEMRKGELTNLTYTFALPNRFIGYAAVDAAARRINGQDAYWGRDKTKVPYRVVLPSTAEHYKEGYLEPDFSLDERFGKVWG